MLGVKKVNKKLVSIYKQQPIFFTR